MSTYDFGYGPVPAHKHPNGGGWVADSAEVSNKAYVGVSAKIAGGTIWGGTIWGGIIRGGTISKTPLMAQRGCDDGYCFVVHPVNGEVRVWAWCRNFSWDEAIAHWNDEHYAGPESQRILHFLRAELDHRWPNWKQDSIDDAEKESAS